MSKIININVAEMAVGYNDTHIRTSSIGSCVVVVLYDEVARVGGMAHAMLPTRLKSKGHDEGLRESDNESPAKYTDEAIDRLLEEVEAIGGKKESVKAKLIGGAKMFQVLGGKFGGIGDQNVEAAKKRLQELGIPLESEDTGGTIGKVAELNLETGLVEVTTKM